MTTSIMDTIVNRILSLKHWEIFVIFSGLLFVPLSLTSNNFYNLIIKITLILILTYIYFFGVLIFINSKLGNEKNTQEFKIAKTIFYIRAITVLSLPILFLINNLALKINTSFIGFATYLIILIPLAILSSIAWLYFLNFIAKNLLFLEKGKLVTLSEYFGYLIAFLFIPIGVFIVQPILNKLYVETISH